MLNDYPKLLELLYTLGQIVTSSNTIPMTADDVISVTAIYPEWTEGQHNAESVVQHDSQPWRCLQTHDSTGNPDWCPGVAPSLWGAFHGTTPDHALPWQAPTGAHDCYNKGEYIIWTDNNVYQSLIDGNVYSPEDYPNGWAVYTE